jgi:hypothetical protein
VAKELQKVIVPANTPDEDSQLVNMELQNASQKQQQALLQSAARHPKSVINNMR